MKNIKAIISLILVSSLFVAANSIAQRGMKWRGSGGWGPGSQYGKMYDVNTVNTISGDVVSVERFTARKGIADGVHLILKTEQETMTVHLGPGWFVDDGELAIAVNDEIKVTGSRITYDDKPAIIAREIIKGENVLKLRDEKGFPLWRGWRMR